MELWCNWCARWTEDPEVVVRIDGAPQSNYRSSRSMDYRSEYRPLSSDQGKSLVNVDFFQRCSHGI